MVMLSFEIFSKFLYLVGRGEAGGSHCRERFSTGHSGSDTRYCESTYVHVKVSK